MHRSTHRRGRPRPPPPPMDGATLSSLGRSAEPAPSCTELALAEPLSLLDPSRRASSIFTHPLFRAPGVDGGRATDTGRTDGHWHQTGRGPPISWWKKLGKEVGSAVLRTVPRDLGALWSTGPRQAVSEPEPEGDPRLPGRALPSLPV